MRCGPRRHRARNCSSSTIPTSTPRRTCRTPTSPARSTPAASRSIPALPSWSSPSTSPAWATRRSSSGIPRSGRFAAGARASRALALLLALSASACFRSIPDEDLPSDPIAFVRQAASEGILSLDQFRDALSIEGSDYEEGEKKTKLRTSLAILQPRTGEISTVPDSGIGTFPLDWSPDGGRLLIGRADPMTGNLRLWTWNRLTNAWIAVSKNRVGTGAGIADGPIRVAWHGPIMLPTGKQAGAIWINTDDNGDEVIPNTTGCWQPDVSPDGKTVVFAKQESKSKLDSIIMLATLGETELRPLTRGSHPRFSRDGRFIVFQRDLSSGNSDIWIMRSDGGAKRQITNTDDIEEYPSLSPDGRYVVYASVRGDVKESHLFVARVSDGVEQEVTHNGQASRPVW